MARRRRSLLVTQERLDAVTSIFGDVARYTAGWASVIVCSVMSVFIFGVLIHEFMCYIGYEGWMAFCAEVEAGTFSFWKEKETYTPVIKRGARRRTKMIDVEEDREEGDQSEGATEQSEEAPSAEKVPDTMGLSTKLGGISRRAATIEEEAYVDPSVKGLRTSASESAFVLSNEFKLPKGSY